MSAVALATLADEINYEHAHALDHAHAAVRRARRAGELLLQAKERCEHGEWLPWLKANCPRISERTAQAYMRVARKCLCDDAKAEQLELLTLGEALEQLVEPNRSSMSDSESATAADLPKREFNPRNFHRRMAEIDDDIQRGANRMWGDFKVDTDGLDRFERSKAWIAMLNTPPANIPIAVGYVTLGSIGEAPVAALVESREHPGYWHDIDLREGNTSKHPVKPLGLMYRYARSAYTWTTAPDDGTYAQFCGEVSP